MSIVVFEDDDQKYISIKDALNGKGVRDSSIQRVRTISQFATLGRTDIELCIIDLLMPGTEGGSIRDAGLEILQMLDYSGLQRVPVLAITAYPDQANALRSAYSARGCIIYSIDEKDIWMSALDIFLAQARDRGRYDFVIFAAIAEERNAFRDIQGLNIESVSRYGIDHWDCEINGRSGTIILLPRMGLVNATALVSRVLELYSPEVVAMTGICAGIGKDVSLGQLLVADLCWEYQSGKWLDDAFIAEPYQVNIPSLTRATVSKMLENKELLRELESGHLGYRPSEPAEPKLAVFASGSAVIASAERLEHVKQQHRRVGGLDMEIFGFHKAVEFSGKQMHAFCAKVVVDMADSNKDDRMHTYGAHISAKFVLKAIDVMLLESGNGLVR